MLPKTRILWLYQYEPRYNFDDWFHMRYVEYLTKHPGIEIYAYGPRIDEGYPKLAISAYSKTKLLEHIYQEFPFDLVIANTKSRMFAYYSPNTKRAEGCWLPDDFKTFPKPKIMIEEDFHYEENDVWYQEVGFDLLMNRHYRNALRQGVMKHVWLPFSVDPEIFHPDQHIKRINKLCLAASVTPKIYECRKLVYETLFPLELLEGFTTQHWVGRDYVQCLRSYVSHVSCSSIYHITPAKMFEIMASRSVLFTNRSGKYGLTELFPNDAYCTYANDGSDILDQANKILNDPDFAQETAIKGQHCILQRHTHYIRTEEMLTTIRRELDL